MAAVGTVRIIWSGGEDDFCATPLGTHLAIEDRCKAGVGEIYQRVVNGNWKIYDITEVIRLSLIGAGMSAEKAKEKVDIHVLQNPNGLAPSIMMVTRILEVVLVGVVDDTVGKKEAAEQEAPGSKSTTTTDDFAAQLSTVLEPPSSGQPEISIN